MQDIVKKRKKPTSAGVRHAVEFKNNLLSKDKYKKLLVAKKRTGGRNSAGRITVRHRGGGHKKLYRVIDFKRNKHNIEGRVERFEYDPNRSSYLALIVYKDGERRFIIAPSKLKQNDIIMSGDNAPIKVGNSLPLNKIPVGTVIHCIEMKPGKGAQLARSAGAAAQLIAIEDDGRYAVIRLASKETRRIPALCQATVGEVGNKEHNLRKLGKAGAKRHRGIRPTVRGVVMNPVDHPHGGGEGKTSGGRHPVTPWGQPTKGKKTRKNKRTDNYILRRRTK